MSGPEIALLNLPDLNDPAVVEVLPFDMAGLPPVGLLEEFRDELREHEFIARRDVFGGHRCERCNGRNQPNPNYVPTDGEIADPLAWIVQTRSEELWSKRVDITSVTFCRESNIANALASTPKSVLMSYRVFFTSPYVPCRHAFDWKALAALIALASPLPNRKDTISSIMYENGFDGDRFILYGVGSALREPGRFVHNFQHYEHAAEYLAAVQEYDRQFDAGELDDYRRQMNRVTDFGPYPWSITLPLSFDQS